jgi:hypothetical protein
LDRARVVERSQRPKDSFEAEFHLAVFIRLAGIQRGKWGRERDSGLQSAVLEGALVVSASQSWPCISIAR